jgi:hypothetical protein
MTLLRKSMLLILFVLVAGLVAAGVSVFAPGLPSEILDKAKDSVTGMLTGSNSLNQTKFEISADLVLKPLELTKASSITLEFTKPASQISVNSEKLDLSQIEQGSLDLQNFDGSMKISETASLSGKASELSVNKVRVLPEAKSLDVNFDMNYDLVMLNLQLDRFLYTSSGKVSVNSDQITVQLSNEELNLINFAGNFTVLQGKLQIRGTADNVKVAGKTLEAEIR